jgi:NAD-dependent dihydropyrimidine dehydrogenase PreA subunit
MVMMKAPKIEIDYAKCTTPFACKVCIEACPQAVFRVTPNYEKKGMETPKHEPGSWKVVAFYRDQCTLCGICAKVCPVGALKIVTEGA